MMPFVFPSPSRGMPPHPAIQNYQSRGKITGLTLRTTMMARYARKDSQSATKAHLSETLPADILLMIRDELRNDKRALAIIVVRKVRPVIFPRDW